MDRNIKIQLFKNNFKKRLGYLILIINRLHEKRLKMLKNRSVQLPIFITKLIK